MAGLRLTRGEASRLGLDVPSVSAEKSQSDVRKRISEYIAEINSAECSVRVSHDEIKIVIRGIGLPSWNVVKRWNWRESYSYKKAWVRLVYGGALEAGFPRRRCSLPHDAQYDLSIMSYRPRLLDIDNHSAKDLIDGIVHSGILPDDRSKYIKRYSVDQDKCSSTEGYTIIATLHKR